MPAVKNARMLRPVSPEGKGLGVVFRGMMQSEDAPLFGDGISKAEAEELRLRIKNQGMMLRILKEKVDYLMLPFWERWWLKIRRIFHV